MLEYLKLRNVGPAALLELEFATRLNLLTGDNGLGKTFLLDVAWYSLTNRWPAEVNPALTTGRMARPRGTGAAFIHSRLGSTQRLATSEFDRALQSWGRNEDRPEKRGAVIYAQVDGSFSVWDPGRNYWRSTGVADVSDRPKAYVFSPAEVWNGLQPEGSPPLCNGLINDWAGWQKEGGDAFQQLKAVLSELSPDESERLLPGKLTRVSLNDVRDTPTLTAPYGIDVAVLHASAGIRRIIAFAYLLVWTWQEHLRACELLDRAPTNRITFLLDEVEAHLHPRWQRTILQSLMKVASPISLEINIQIIAATHSPLVMASAEPWFDPARDAWFDLDLTRDNGTSHVTLVKRDFEPQGEASDWLTSEAFDLGGAGSLERQRALEKAALILSNEQASLQDAREIHDELRRLLPEADPFWMRWRHVGEKRGWWP